jgi:hypothetical protein
MRRLPSPPARTMAKIFFDDMVISVEAQGGRVY